MTAEHSWSDVETLSKKSLDYLSKGITLFDEIGDPVNAAMLYSNCGRVYRLCAQAVADLVNPSAKKREFSSLERQYLDQVNVEVYHCRVLWVILEEIYCSKETAVQFSSLYGTSIGID